MVRLEKYDIEHDVTELMPQSVLLQTCKRTEVYKGDGSVSESTIRHLFRLVCGLDSPILGESAIQGQIKRAYQDAHDKGLSRSLHSLFQTALKVGKKVRMRTALTQIATSYEKVVVQLLYDSLPSLADTNITIIGAHNMSENIMAYLTHKDAGTILIANRTYDKAYALAQRYDAVAVRFDQLKGALRQTDVIISATSAPHYIINEEDIPSGKRLTLIDLAMPADINPYVADMVGVSLYTLQNIHAIAKQNEQVRGEMLERAESIVEEEVIKYIRKQARYYG